MFRQTKMNTVREPLSEYHLFSYQSRAHVQQSIYRQQRIIFPNKILNFHRKYLLYHGYVYGTWYNRTMLVNSHR